jgi:hypothetical protein
VPTWLEGYERQLHRCVEMHLMFTCTDNGFDNLHNESIGSSKLQDISIQLERKKIAMLQAIQAFVCFWCTCGPPLLLIDDRCAVILKSYIFIALEKALACWEWSGAGVSITAVVRLV